MAQEKKRAPYGKNKTPEHVTEQDRRAALRKLQEEVLPVLGVGKIDAAEAQAWEAALQELASKFPFNRDKTTSKDLTQAQRAAQEAQRQVPPRAPALTPKPPGTTGTAAPVPGDPTNPQRAALMASRRGVGRPAPGATPKQPGATGTAPPAQGDQTAAQRGALFASRRGAPAPALTPKPPGTTGTAAPGGQGPLSVRDPRAPGLPAAETPLPTRPDLGPGYDPIKGPTKVDPTVPPGTPDSEPAAPGGKPSGGTASSSTFAQRLGRLQQTTQNAGMEVPPPRRLSPRSRFTMTPRLVNPPLSTSTGAPLPFMTPTPLPAATPTPQAAASVRDRANQLSQRLSVPSSPLPYLPPTLPPVGPQPVTQEAAPASGSLRDIIRGVRLGGK